MKDLRKSIANQTGFALRLAHRIGSDHASDSNFVFSPLSLHLVLSMFAAGSRGGKCEQIASFLCSGSPEKLITLASHLVSVVLADGSAAGGPLLSATNRVWFDFSRQLNPSFKKILTSVFKAKAAAIDFRNKAFNDNPWVENASTRVIKKLYSENASTRMTFVNVLNFKCSWEEKFNKPMTRNSKFHLLNGNVTKTPFMSGDDKQFVCVQNGFKVLRLPYKRGKDERQFSMYIFLPDSRDGLWSLIQKISTETLEPYLPKKKLLVGKFRLPRFKTSFSFEAKEVFKSFGLDLFSCNDELIDDQTVDELVPVSLFSHHSCIEVNEDGTEQAITTAIEAAGCPPPMGGRVDFVADHPFVFLIREDHSQVILFLGHVVDPSTL